jgi:hypothetical protein
MKSPLHHIGFLIGAICIFLLGTYYGGYVIASVNDVIAQEIYADKKDKKDHGKKNNHKNNNDKKKVVKKIKKDTDIDKDVTKDITITRNINHNHCCEPAVVKQEQHQEQTVNVNMDDDEEKIVYVTEKHTVYEAPTDVETTPTTGAGILPYAMLFPGGLLGLLFRKKSPVAAKIG